MASDLLATKLRRPALAAKRVHRPRLLQRLNDGLDSGRRVTLVSAPPGFGKTMLLSAWVAENRRLAAWLSLDEGDNDPIRFWSYLIAACQSIRDKVGAAALALLHAPQPLSEEVIPTILINDLAGLEDSFVLILDDYHVIQNQSIHTALAFLIDHLPDQLHLVLSTRVDPPWPFARLRARNQLIELRALDLRFTPDEAAVFLNQLMGLNLSAESIATLEARTEGWIAGLQLAALAMQAPLSLKGHSDIAGFVTAFAGSHLYVADYLIEEVLQRQPAEVQTFLLQTSLLERLNGALCEAVTGCHAGQNILRQLYKANLFVTPLDDEGYWFRYHRLFADLLQVRLQQAFPCGVIATLHQRASRWSEAAGMINEAVQHAVAAADYVTAVRLIESNAVEMLMQGYTKTVESWLTAIPAELHLQSPKINLAFAWMHLLRGAYAAAAPYVERLHRGFARSPLDEAAPALRSEWLALQAHLLSAQGRLAESLELAHRARDLAPETDGYVQSLAYNALGSAYLLQNDYQHAVAVYQKAIQLGRAAANALVEMMGISVLSQIATQHGQLHFAYEVASQGIDRIERSGSPPSIVAAVYGALGQIQYQWGHLAEAQSHLRRAIQLCALSGYVAGEVYGRANLSRLLQLERNLEASEQELQKAIELTQSGAPVWGGEETVAQGVRLHLAQHRLAAAESALATQGFSFHAGFTFPDLAPELAITYASGLLYNSALRILLYRARTQPDQKFVQSGIELADRLISGALQSQYLSIALETLLLRAQLHVALGNAHAGQADVAQALELAAPEGFISIFFEEGKTVKALIARCQVMIEQSPAPPGEQRNRLKYIDRLLAAFPLTASQNTSLQSKIRNQKSEILVEPLTPRELEVLHLIAAGDSNQAIADKLVITVRAVKKHTGNIYGKLNVSRRTQAVARARQLGLLPVDG
ncbi:serine/threonine-protein kinase PknK [Thermoflexales bacterium]|nr:serine/threonine-protein kinase PknK [Thermoflexales bacterium]